MSQTNQPIMTKYLSSSASCHSSTAAPAPKGHSVITIEVQLG